MGNRCSNLGRVPQRIIHTESNYLCYDQLALFTLSGQFKGKLGCVACIDDTAYVSLTASKKIVYMRHRRFLSKGHRYRQKKIDKYFDNNS